VQAQFIALKITAVHGGFNNTSIAELQFDGTLAIPEPSTVSLLALGGLVLLRRLRA
jgi:hypothetical protein